MTGFLLMTAWLMAQATAPVAPPPSPEPPVAQSIGEGVWFLPGDLGRAVSRTGIRSCFRRTMGWSWSIRGGTTGIASASSG